MNYIHYFNYNNYINRTVKGYQTLRDYIDNATAYIGRSNLVNFNKTNELEASITYYMDSDIIPDYAIVTDDTDSIVSRWFVISETRNNKNNYQLDFKRDIVFDNLNAILNNEDTLIKRGFPANLEDATILNNEDFSFNEYKQNEIKLTDEAWIICFINNIAQSKFTTKRGNAYMSTIFDFVRDSDIEIDLWGEHGFSIIAFPLIALKSNSVGVKFYINGSLINNITFGSGTVDLINSETGRSKVSSNSISRFLISELIINESILDIQIVPKVNGLTYTLTNDELNIYMNYSYNFGSLFYYRLNVEEHPYENRLILPIVYKTDLEFSKTIPLNSIINKTISNNNILDIKQIEGFKCYLQSPDRSSSAELDLRRFIVKDDEDETYILNPTFKIQCFYQPYQSFVYIKPNVTEDDGKSYFGYEGSDDRYLICGYNNQILRTTSTWLNFLMNNKNYLNSFNLEMRDAKINAIAGTIGAGISGATSGAIAGSVATPVGSIVGAAVGAVVGTGTALAQNLVNIDEKRKTFMWNCDNIKSQPQGISKIASYNQYTNAVSPVLTIYYNEISNNLFQRYLKLNNCSINIIDKVSNHIGSLLSDSEHDYSDYNYIVANLIKLNDFDGTADELLEIQNELERGLYFDIDSNSI